MRTSPKIPTKTKKRPSLLRGQEQEQEQLRPPNWQMALVPLSVLDLPLVWPQLWQQQGSEQEQEQARLVPGQEPEPEQRLLEQQ